MLAICVGLLLDTDFLWIDTSYTSLFGFASTLLVILVLHHYRVNRPAHDTTTPTQSYITPVRRSRRLQSRQTPPSGSQALTKTSGAGEGIRIGNEGITGFMLALISFLLFVVVDISQILQRMDDNAQDGAKLQNVQTKSSILWLGTAGFSFSMVITHSLGGRARSSHFQTFQPFHGGPSFVTLQVKSFINFLLW